REHLAHLLGEGREVDRQEAGRDTDAVHPVDHHQGLRATTTSTTVPGAANVPAAGRCAITVPGVPSLERRRVTVPSARPSCSRRVRASACDRPSNPGTAIVGAPRLTTTVTGAPGASSVVAAGRVSIVTPGAAAACTDSTCATVSPAATISCCASGPSRPVTWGTGILGGPSLRRGRAASAAPRTGRRARVVSTAAAAGHGGGAASARPREARRVRTVHSVALWQGLEVAVRSEQGSRHGRRDGRAREVAVGRQELGHDVTVLLRLERAGTVDEQ